MLTSIIKVPLTPQCGCVSKMKIALLFMLFSCASFVLGYIFANRADSAANEIQMITHSKKALSLPKALGAFEACRQVDNVPELANISHIRAESTQKIALPTFEHDLGGILDSIAALRTQGASKAEIAAQFDRMKQMMSEQQSMIDSAMSLLNEHAPDSSEFQLLLAAVQVSSNDTIDQSLLFLAEQYAMSSDPSDQEKFITLLSSTRSDIKSSVLIESLNALVNDTHADLNYRLAALSHIKPEDVSWTNKARIIDTLMSEIGHSNSDKAEKLMPYLMRFSAYEERPDLISNLLSKQYSNEVHIAVLENINAATIQSNDQIKELLQKIADSSTSNLNSLAKEALAYANY